MDEIQKVLVKLGRKDLAQKYYLKVKASQVKNLAKEVRILITNEPVTYEQLLQADLNTIIHVVKKTIKNLNAEKEFDQAVDRKAVSELLKKYNVENLYNKRYEEERKEHDRKIETLKKQIYREFPVMEKIQKDTSDGDIAFIDKMNLTRTNFYLEFGDPNVPGYRNEYRRRDFSEDEVASIKKYVSLIR